MNDRDVKTLLKSAYQITPTAREKEFIRENEKRQISLPEVVLLEMGHMKFNSCFTVVALVLMFILLSKTHNPGFMWYVSGTLPIVSLVLTSGLGKSERHGMHELEASSRFSLKLVRLVRMMVVGAASICLIAAGSLLLQRQVELGLVSTIGFVGTPYMLSAWGGMLVTRKWHDDNNMIGCMSVTVLSCMLPILFERVARLNAWEPGLIVGCLIVTTALTVRECIIFVRESEEIEWNFV